MTKSLKFAKISTRLQGIRSLPRIGLCWSTYKLLEMRFSSVCDDNYASRLSRTRDTVKLTKFVWGYWMHHTALMMAEMWLHLLSLTQQYATHEQNIITVFNQGIAWTVSRLSYLLWRYRQKPVPGEETLRLLYTVDRYRVRTQESENRRAKIARSALNAC